MNDNVNHPSHYTQGGVECIDALEAATIGLHGIEAVCTANAIKYLWRWRQKNGAEDLRKARWYIDRLINKHTPAGTNTNPTDRKIIAVDFDGTLCENCWPAIGDPNWDVIHRLLEEKAKGAKIILWTCREDEMLREAVSACERWGLYFDAVNENLPDMNEKYGNDCRKIGATEYWDDKAVRVMADGTRKDGAGV